MHAYWRTQHGCLILGKLEYEAQPLQRPRCEGLGRVMIDATVRVQKTHSTSWRGCSTLKLRVPNLMP